MQGHSRVALITGITGQDGSYLAEFLCEKGYRVVGTTSKSGSVQEDNLKNIKDRIEIIEGDITDPTFLTDVIEKLHPDELYNLASVSTVASPWEDPVTLSLVTGIAPLNILETLRKISPTTKFFQASSAEMYGEVTESPQNEETSFCPRNPYGMAKLFAHQMTEAYRDQHNLFAVSGILFNHESPRRRDEFVTKKIAHTLVDIKHGDAAELVLGNLDAKRDWSFAGDIVEGMWMSLQHDVPGTYVFSSGEVHTVRDFVEETALALDMLLTWEGEGVEEVGKDNDGKVIVRVSTEFYRPVESHIRQGDNTKAKDTIGWSPRTDFKLLVGLMVKGELNKK